MASMHNYNKKIIELCLEAAPTARKVLDFGAGIGTIAEGVRQERLRQGGECIVACLEPDLKQATMLKAAGFPVYDSLSALPQQGFDFIYSINVLEHVHDEQAVLAQLNSALKSGGIMALWVPASMLLWTEMDSRIGHVRRYSRQQLIETLQQAGLQVHRCDYQDSLGFFAALAVKLLERRAKTQAQATPKVLNDKTMRLYDRLLFPLSKILDKVVRHSFGKNLFIVAQKP